MPMKTVSEAMGLRNALLANFERALTCATERERQELLNVVIVGGGATGVEIAGALSEMKNFVLPKDYPDLPTSLMHIYPIEAGDRLLASMSQESSAHVERYLREHEDGLSFTELAGIGRYYLAKAARSGTAEHRRDCEHVAELLERKTDGEEDEADIETVADALELLQKCGRTDHTRLRRLEKRVGICTCTPLEHAHRMFRLYGLTGDEYFKVCVREELEHLPPQLLDLGGALALAEMLSFDSNGLIS